MNFLKTYNLEPRLQPLNQTQPMPHIVVGNNWWEIGEKVMKLLLMGSKRLEFAISII